MCKNLSIPILPKICQLLEDKFTPYNNYGDQWAKHWSKKNDW